MVSFLALLVCMGFWCFMFELGPFTYVLEGLPCDGCMYSYSR